MTNMKIAVIGVGAVGSYIGAYLTREGFDITLIDMWAYHVESMKENGLSVSGSQGDFVAPVEAYHVSDAMQLKGHFDVVFLSVKSYDSEWVAHFAKRFLAKDGVVVSAQNCMNDRLIGSIVGFERVIGCVMSGITVSLWEPGHVNRGGEPGQSQGHFVFRVGELFGQITPRVNEISQMLSCIDLSMSTSNIWGERWSKLTMNAASNPLTAMTGLGSLGLSELSHARKIQIKLMKESCEVGLSQNYSIEPIKGIDSEIWVKADVGDVFERLEEKFLPVPGSSDWQSSMAQDVAKGRKTEIGFMNGYIASQGKLMGVATPFHNAVTQIVKEIDNGSRLPNVKNIDDVIEMAN